MIALTLILKTIPAVVREQREATTELIGAFRAAVDKLGTKIDTLGEKVDALDPCLRPTLRVFHPDTDPPKGA